MNRQIRLLAAALLASIVFAGAPARGDDIIDNPGVSVGLAFAFNGSQPSAADIGFTAKILSNRHENNPVLGAGLTLYPWAEKKLGLDVGVGYNFTDVTTMAGYDFLQQKILMSSGWSNTEPKQSSKKKPNNEPDPPKQCVIDNDCSEGEGCVSGICTASP